MSLLYDPALSNSQSSLCLRSRRLLRDTLLKDQSLRNHSTASLPLLPAPTTMALASPPSTPFRPPADYSPSRSRHYQSLSHSPSASPMRPTTRPERQRATESHSSIPRRPHTATHTRDHSRSPLSNSEHPSQPQPHLITPHEQVLRSRLERVLFSAGVADDTSKRRERDRGRTTSPAAGPSFAPTSANGSTRTVKRTRANTDSNAPISPPPSSHYPRLAASSPGSKHPSRCASPVRQKARTSTGRSKGSDSTSASCSGSGSGKRSGTTPPLVPDDEDHVERREPRLLLLTPPATPSPPGYEYFQASSDWGYKPQCYQSTRDEEEEEDDDDDDDESCSSSYSSYREGSSISSSALHSYATHQRPLQLRTPTSPQPKIPLHSPHTPLRPFNARHASAQCRAMDGYVSFANVEGLGVPPDEPASPHSHSQEKGTKGVLTALGWGGGVVRKILGGGVEKPEDAPGGVVY